jgi:hypothetical protein
VAEVIAGTISAILSELLAEAEIGRTVKPGDEPVDHGLGHQVETADPAKDRRI